MSVAERVLEKTLHCVRMNLVWGVDGGTFHMLLCHLAQIQIQKPGSNTKEYRYCTRDTVNTVNINNSGEEPLTGSHTSINCVTWFKYKEILLAQIQIQKHTNTVDGKKPL